MRSKGAKAAANMGVNFAIAFLIFFVIFNEHYYLILLMRKAIMRKTDFTGTDRKIP